MLTANKRQRLRIDLKDWEGNTAYAEYNNFRVDSEFEKYRLSSLGNYTGTAGRYDMKNAHFMFGSRVFEVGGSNEPTSGWLGAILENFKWPYLWNGSSDRLRV